MKADEWLTVKHLFANKLAPSLLLDCCQLLDLTETQTHLLTHNKTSLFVPTPTNHTPVVVLCVLCVCVCVLCVCVECVGECGRSASRERKY